MPIYAPKIVVFGRFDPLNEEPYQRNPQRRMTYIDRQNRSTGATCVRD